MNAWVLPCQECGRGVVFDHEDYRLAQLVFACHLAHHRGDLNCVQLVHASLKEPVSICHLGDEIWVVTLNSYPSLPADARITPISDSGGTLREEPLTPQ